MTSTDPVYNSNQVARSDGTPFYYESLDLDIPVFCRIEGIPQNPLQERTMKVHLIKEGRKVTCRVERFKWFSAEDTNGFQALEQQWTSFNGNTQEVTVPIPRRFLPQINDQSSHQGSTGEVLALWGRTSFPILMTLDGSNNVSVGYMNITTINTRNIAPPYQEIPKSYGFIEFLNPQSLDYGTIMATDVEVSWLTDSVYNDIKEGWWTKDVQAPPMINPILTVEEEEVELLADPGPSVSEANFPTRQEQEEVVETILKNVAKKVPNRPPRPQLFKEVKLSADGTVTTKEASVVLDDGGASTASAPWAK
jgi:hypothetical protein